jgi:ectoine hydroxylase-related dioxygenase (phytanoyl-CoA dioxygenase family)
MRDKVLEVSHRRSGIKPDLATGESHANVASPFGQMTKLLLLEDPIFEQALMNEASVALVNYLLGERSLLSSSRGFVKGSSSEPLGLHVDFLAPPPFPPYASMCNVTCALTDYSEEDGGIAFVPGSHRFARRPEGDEATDQAVPVNAPAGSLIVFDGYTWHGAFARRSAGLRVAYANLFCRPYLFTLEKYQDVVPKEVLSRNSQRSGISWVITWGGNVVRKEPTRPNSASLPRRR